MSYKECVYHTFCIDRGCPCKLIDHEHADLSVIQDLIKELEDAINEHDGWYI